ITICRSCKNKSMWVSGQTRRKLQSPAQSICKVSYGQNAGEILNTKKRKYENTKSRRQLLLSDFVLSYFGVFVLQLTPCGLVLALLIIPSAAAAADGDFVAIAADGTRAQGSLSDCGDKDGLTLDGDKQYHIKPGELVELRRVTASVPAQIVGRQVW